MSYLLKLILFCLVIYYVVRFFSRGLSALFGGPDNRPRHSENSPRRPEGDVRIENNRAQNSRIRRDEGEYVDFEEIE
jgi:hypothetical protein